MTTERHPLSALLPPLRYACQSDFARLSKVRDLRSVLVPAIRTAAEQGVPEAHLAGLKAELPSIDDARDDVRKRALRRVLGSLAHAGLALPPDLAQLAERPSGTSSAKERSRSTAVGGNVRGMSAASSGAVNSGRVPAASPGARRPETSEVAKGAGVDRRSAVSARPGASGLEPGGRASSRANGDEAQRSRSARAASMAETLEGALDAERGAHGANQRPPARSGRGDVPAKSSATRRTGLTGRGNTSRAPSLALGEAAAKRRKRSAGASESRSEAKLLSIAPKAGPLSVSLRDLKMRLNPRLIGTLDKKGLRRAGDVLFLLPRCYEDRRKLRKIAELTPGERGVTVGTVRASGESMGRGGRRMFRATLSDATGSIAATFFQSGPWLKGRFPVGKRLIISGEVRATPSGWEMSHPEVEPADDLESSSVHFNRIVPVYPGFERHEQRMFRELASTVAQRFAALIEEPLPATLRRKLGLMSLGEALERIHLPLAEDDLDALDRHMSPAHQRLAFDELFFLQLGLGLRRRCTKSDPGIAFDTSPARLKKAEAAAPFTLTGAQRRVVKEIAADMAVSEPMNRLVQGDVGSGKTAVALVAGMVALQDGHQVALMAPTELLAEQHHKNFCKWLEPLGYRTVLLTSGGTAKSRREQRQALAAGEYHVAVGTHALLEENVEFARLGLAVIDEQHRFGVMQRRRLMKKGVMPDTLLMTATPIPRTLAMTLYGDLDTSRIDELPPGRTPIETRVFGASQRARVYEELARELELGHQAYVVYPLVEESEKIDLADATQGAEKMLKAFPDRSVGLLHGRMKADEKELVMRAFRNKEIDILVSTTVVEVGVDVPNASVMIIEQAERFGLSQLHQLRGRVGRGAAKSYCFLVAQAQRSAEASERLAVMEKSSDGVVIAEKDLEIRGPGEFLGTRQSGMPELAVANLARDVLLLQTAREEALAVVSADPELSSAENRSLARALEERWEGRLSLAGVG